ncbi:hypothetical protein [Methylobacter sp. S3L5C]|uniref:hypothetical protein n=1 Tax=Methylobacter sp. S3L5C TaxID=2839024 RepID=UPI001FABCC3F|nr:hypothetical protein [Methylobacter sp. S3L5C]UOA07372.1 hypothetical protein KKZ03_13940 [Methylobacter sp. S3L5C]
MLFTGIVILVGKRVSSARDGKLELHNGICHIVVSPPCDWIPAIPAGMTGTFEVAELV